MGRNRTIYNSEILYCGPCPSTTGHFAPNNVGAGTNGYSGVSGSTNSGVNLINQLYRVQSASYQFNIARTDIEQFGQLGALERAILDSPTVGLTFKYILSNFKNERSMGLHISSGVLTTCLSGILNKTQDDRNYFVKTHSAGVDAIGNNFDAPYNVYAFGNGFLNSYQVDAQVGQFPTATVGIEALNMNFDTINIAPGQTILPTGIVVIPAVNPGDGSRITQCTYDLPLATGSPSGFVFGTTAPSALRPGDITVDISQYNEGGINSSGNSINVQSCSIGMQLKRDALQKLGSQFYYSRELSFPLQTTFSCTALVGDFATGSLGDIIDRNNVYNLSLSINRPNTTTVQTSFLVQGAYLDGISYSSAIGSNKTATLNFSAPIGSSLQQAGLFLSGAN